MKDYHYFVSFVSKKSNYEIGFGYCDIIILKVQQYLILKNFKEREEK